MTHTETTAPDARDDAARRGEVLDELIATYRVQVSAGHRLRRAHQIAVAIYADEVDGALSPRQFTTLISLYQEPGLLQIDLTDRIGADRSTVSGVVDRLEKRGLIRRERRDGNDRVAELFVTDAGIDALIQATPGAVRVHDRILARLPEHLRQPFLEALGCLADTSRWSKGQLDRAAFDPPERAKE